MIAVGCFPRIPFRKCQCWVVNDSVTRANVVLDVVSREGLKDHAVVSLRVFPPLPRQGTGDSRRPSPVAHSESEGCRVAAEREKVDG